MIDQNLEKKFSKNFKWSVFGTFFYEGLKLFHQFLLFKLLTSTNYGLIGTIFSIIYLTVYLSDLGWTNSITPFLDLFISSKQNFKKVFLKIYFFPQFIILALFSFVSVYLYTKAPFYEPKSILLLLIPIIIISESIRIFLRRFLHILFLSKKIVILESFLILFYLAIVWIPYLIFKIKLDQNFIFTTYLIDSIVGVIGLLFLLIKFYLKLENQPYNHPTDFFKRIIKTRFFNYSIQVSKNLFTGNFLTPFFAINFGLNQAGISFLANHIAESLKSVLKVTIIFSGNALLAKLKNFSLESKKSAFKLLSNKLNLILFPLIIFCLINYQLILNFKHFFSITRATLSLTLIFLFITLIEYFFLLYEQFYILEEAASKLFIFKLLEFILFFIFIKSQTLISPYLTLLGIAAIKILSFVIISLNAYYSWQIKLSFKISYKYIFFCVFLSPASSKIIILS